MRKSIELILLLGICFPLVVMAQQLNIGDGVRITFFNISDPISGDYFIQADGYIQLPYIGLVEATARNFEDVRQEIVTKYDSLYRNPELTVQPLFKISILGEVKSPGLYYVTGVEKLSDVIAMAGGETSDANLEKIYFTRGEKRININAQDILEKGRKLQEIGLKSGDRIYVPRKWWVGVRNASVIISAATIILVTIITVSTR